MYCSFLLSFFIAYLISETLPFLRKCPIIQDRNNTYFVYSICVYTSSTQKVVFTTTIHYTEWYTYQLTIKVSLWIPLVLNTYMNFIVQPQKDSSEYCRLSTHRTWDKQYLIHKKINLCISCYPSWKKTTTIKQFILPNTPCF